MAVKWLPNRANPAGGRTAYDLRSRGCPALETGGGIETKDLLQERPGLGVLPPEATDLLTYTVTWLLVEFLFIYGPITRDTKWKPLIIIAT
jgi:hypothetical protein